MKQILFAIILLALYGCDNEKIKTYEVDKNLNTFSTDNIFATKKAPSLVREFSSILPEGWKEIAPSGMRKISYTIANSSIDFYAISLGMGDVTSNVNRWRKQINLPEQSREEILSCAKELNASGVPVKYFEIMNKDINKGILAAIIDLNSIYWFFTAKGNVEDLNTHSADIQRFINSIYFN